MKGATNPLADLKEDDLKSGDIQRKKGAIFAPESILRKFEALPAEVKNRLKWYGEEYYNRAIDDIQQCDLHQSAHEILVTVKSGLSPNDLSDDEKIILRKAYGPKWYEQAGLESETD
jgi:hypothetical protein